MGASIRPDTPACKCNAAQRNKGATRDSFVVPCAAGGENWGRCRPPRARIRQAFRTRLRGAALRLVAPRRRPSHRFRAVKGTRSLARRPIEQVAAMLVRDAAEHAADLLGEERPPSRFDSFARLNVHEGSVARCRTSQTRSHARRARATRLQRGSDGLGSRVCARALTRSSWCARMQPRGA